MAKYLNISIYIGLLDFEKAFDFMNRTMLLKDLKRQGIGSVFLKNLYNMYEKVQYLSKIDDNIMGKQLNAKHGITQGKTCNIFSLYISHMNNPLKDMQLSNIQLCRTKVYIH